MGTSTAPPEKLYPGTVRKEHRSNSLPSQPPLNVGLRHGVTELHTTTPDNSLDDYGRGTATVRGHHKDKTFSAATSEGAMAAAAAAATNDGGDIATTAANTTPTSVPAHKYSPKLGQFKEATRRHGQGERRTQRRGNFEERRQIERCNDIADTVGNTEEVKKNSGIG